MYKSSVRYCVMWAIVIVIYMTLVLQHDSTLVLDIR